MGRNRGGAMSGVVFYEDGDWIKMFHAGEGGNLNILIQDFKKSGL